MLTPDIPFSRDDAHRFIPWMVALMCALAALMLCVSLTLHQWAEKHVLRDDRTLTVQIPYQGAKQEATMRTLATRLEKGAAVERVRVLTVRDVQNLVEPWVGRGTDAAELPLPGVALVMLKPGAKVDVAALEKELRGAVPGASVDQQETWAKRFAALGRLIQRGVMLLALCIIVALGSIMAFAAREGLALHDGTVRLLHTLGAEDDYIARQFQQNALWLALRGAVPGVAVAGALYGALCWYITHTDIPGLSSWRFSVLHAVLLVLLPLLAAALSMMVARLITLARLRALP